MIHTSTGFICAFRQSSLKQGLQAEFGHDLPLLLIMRNSVRFLTSLQIRQRLVPSGKRLIAAKSLIEYGFSSFMLVAPKMESTPLWILR